MQTTATASRLDALRASRLAQRRGHRWLFADLSFEVRPGTALLVVGPNGSGKTTLLRTLAGLARPSAGEVLFGVDPDPAPWCHFLGHLNALKASVTVEENLRFWAEVLGTPTSDAPGRVWRALERLNIDHTADIPAGYLSAGQQRRLALGRLLVADRPVWLLDEPTSSLDAAGSALVAALIDTHTASGGMVIASTHLPLSVRDAVTLDLAPFSRAEPPQ